MAVSWAAMSTIGSSQDDFDADKPIVAAQVIPVSPSTAQWASAGTVAGADETDATYPALRAYDGKPGLDTRSDGTTATPVADDVTYYVLDLGAEYSFDAIAIAGHNFDTLSLTGVTVEIGTDGTFGTTYEVADFTLRGSDKRLVSWALFHTGSAALRYSGVQYVRLCLSKGATFTPQLGELLLLRRAQLSRQPDYPFDDTALFGDLETSMSRGGVIHSTTFARRRHQLAMMYQPTSDEYSEIIAWFRLLRAGFAWCRQPQSLPNAWHMMVMDELALQLPRESFGVRPFAIEASEQGPESCYLDVEDNG